MKALALIIAALIVGALAGRALAEVCAPSGDNYIRSYPPQGTTLNHLPVNEPRCTPYMRDSTASNTPLCVGCHHRQYPSPTVASFLVVYCTSCHPHRSGGVA